MEEKETEKIEGVEKVEYESLWCTYDFTREELQEIAEHLAMKTQELAEVEVEKKSVMSSYKERIDGVAIEISKSARKYKDKNEMRNIECVVERDFKEGVVTYIRGDNGEIAKTTKMTMGERQMHVDDAIKKDTVDVGKEAMDETMETIENDIQTDKTNRLMAGETAVSQ